MTVTVNAEIDGFVNLEYSRARQSSFDPDGSHTLGSFQGQSNRVCYRKVINWISVDLASIPKPQLVECKCFIRMYPSLMRVITSV